MERYEVEAFLAVAEELHFGRAAERLRISTGRVSQTIKLLERRFGAVLFERTSRRVALTPIGRQLQADLRPVVEQMRYAIERATAAGHGMQGTLDIGFGDAAAGQLLLEATELFRTENPGADIRIREVQLSDGLDSCRTDAYDMLLICRPVDEPDFISGPTLMSEPRMLAVPAAHALATRSWITPEDLADITLIRMPTNLPAAMLEDRTPARTPGGRPIAHGLIAHTFQEILALVGAGAGGFIVGAQVTRFYLRPDVVYVPIRDAAPLEWGFVWQATRETARIRAFSDAALRASKQRKH